MFFDVISTYQFLVYSLQNIWSNFSDTFFIVSRISFNSSFIKHYKSRNSAFNGVWEDSCKRFAFCWFLEDFRIGISLFVIVVSGDEFSTGWECKGCKISIVLVSAGGVILIKLLRIFPVSDNLTKWKQSRPCWVFLFSIKFWFIIHFSNTNDKRFFYSWCLCF